MRQPACSVTIAAYFCLAGLLPSCSCNRPPDEPCEGEDCFEALCGDGVDEDQDGHTDCADSDCRAQTCAPDRACASYRCERAVCQPQWKTRSLCRYSKGACDLPEICAAENPECPEDRKAEAGAYCGQGGSRPCERYRACDGVSDYCPQFGYKPAGTVCRPASAECDVPEYCTGADPDCPNDEPAPFGTLCRASSGACDADDFCDGVDGHCPPDRVSPAGQECRPATGPCDEPDQCDGVQSNCANDGRKAPGTVCRPASRECDAPEVCNGMDAECPAESVAAAPAGTVCRAGASACEAPEACDGVGLDCPPPAQGVAPAGTVCRPKAGVCDAEDVCDGVSLECSADGMLSSKCSCGLGQVCTGHAPGCPTWRQENPRPSGDWYAVSTRAPDDVWVAGAGAKTAHWDGKAWTDVPTGFDSCDHEALEGICAIAPDETWAAGGDLLLRWDGKGWKKQLDSKHGRFNGVWGSAKDDVWVVSDAFLAHLDGQHWSFMSTSRSLTRVWGSGRDDVWAVGEGLLHWDGMSWTTVEELAGSDVSAVHGTSRSDVWVATGYQGKVFHYDGTAWTELHWQNLTAVQFVNLWVSDAEIYLVTADEQLLAVDRAGTAWRTVTDQPVRAIAGTSATDLWIAGPGRPKHGNGALFQEQAPGTVLDVTDLAVSPDASTIWAAAGSKVLQGTRGGDWTMQLELPAWLFAVNRLWASGPDDLWVSGFVHTSGADAAVLAHWDGTAWSGTSTPGTPTALGGTGPTSVWLVGLEGLAMRWDGAAWQNVETNTTRDLYALAVVAPDDVWVGAKDAALMHWDGQAWTTAVYTGGGDVVSVAARPGKAWALDRKSDGTVLLSWDGTELKSLSSLPERMNALWRRADDDLWAFGSEDGKVSARRWNGSMWSSVCLTGVGELKCAAGNAAGEIWTGGRGGTILHLGP